MSEIAPNAKLMRPFAAGNALLVQHSTHCCAEEMTNARPRNNGALAAVGQGQNLARCSPPRFRCRGATRDIEQITPSIRVVRVSDRAGQDKSDPGPLVPSSTISRRHATLRFAREGFLRTGPYESFGQPSRVFANLAHSQSL